MKLEKIQLTNFRLFTDFHCDFDPQLTVLVANNGGGKTSLLEGIFFALYPFTGRFPNTGCHDPSHNVDVLTYIENRQLGRISPDYPMEIAVQCKLEIDEVRDQVSDSYTWKLSLKDAMAFPTKTNITALNLNTQPAPLLEISQFPDSSEAPKNWSVLAFYHTSRLSKNEKSGPSGENQASLFKERGAGYTECAAASTSYKLVLNWLNYAEHSNTAEFARHLSKNPDVSMRFSDFEGSFSSLLKAVQNAVNVVLAPSGWKNFYYSEILQDAVMEHDEFGTQPVSRLSDGIRTTIGLVADIAFRAVQLNSHLGENAALETDGIVLIDEVDMHLHPLWQQTILPDLLRAFPKVQFIVTTHSPQVLSSIKREHIRLVGKEHGEIPLAMTYGEESGNVLQAVMEVDPEPPIAEKTDLDILERLVEHGDFASDAARALQQKLELTLGAQHPRLQQMQRSIRRQEALKKFSALEKSQGA